MSWEIEIRDVPASEVLVELSAYRDQAKDKFSDAEIEQQDAMFEQVAHLAIRYGGKQDITVSGHVSSEGAHKFAIQGMVLLDDEPERESELGPMVSRADATDARNQPLFPKLAAEDRERNAKRSKKES